MGLAGAAGGESAAVASGGVVELEGKVGGIC